MLLAKQSFLCTSLADCSDSFVNKYLEQKKEKAMYIGKNDSHCFYNSGETYTGYAVSKSKGDCEIKYSDCKVYAINDDIIYPDDIEYKSIYPKKGSCDDHIMESYNFAKGFKVLYMSASFCVYRTDDTNEMNAAKKAKESCIAESDPRHICVPVAEGTTINTKYSYIEYNNSTQTFVGSNIVCTTTTPGGCKGSFAK